MSLCAGLRNSWPEPDAGDGVASIRKPHPEMDQQRPAIQFGSQGIRPEQSRFAPHSCACKS